MIKRYSINLPKNAKVNSIDRLIKHALKAIKSEIKDKPITLTRFDLEYPYTNNSIYGISYEYSYTTKEEIKLRDDNVEWTKEEKISPPTKELEYIGGEKTSSSLKGLIVRLPQGEEQYDGLKLTEKLAEEIKKLGNVEIHDFVYHDFCDDDGLSHPYFTVYFTQ